METNNSNNGSASKQIAINMMNMNKNKQMIINMIASFISYFISFGISFFLSPYIVKNIGVEANGFVGLANNFISYANLITIALNSVAGRFITIKIHQKDIEDANKYYTSVFYANIFLTVVMAVAATAVVIYLDRLVEVPVNIIADIKLLFAVMFANALVSVVTSVFSVAPFATNLLYVDSLRTIESNIIRVVLIVSLFMLFEPKVSFVGITALVTGVYSALFRVFYARKLLPGLRINKKYYDFKTIVELISSGIWNLITRIGQLLLDGVDLLISNIFISATAMGILSLSKSIPTVISGIVGTVANIFSPDFTILYAEGKHDELVASVKQAMKIMGVICNIPIIILIVCGEPFYKLWQPTQNAGELQILSILTCLGLVISGGINCIYNIFTVVNRLKFNSLLVCASGALSSIIVFVLLKTTDLGLFAVAGVSSFVLIVKNAVFIVPYAARCLDQKWYVFYPDMFRPVLFVLITSTLGYVVKCIIPFSGWIGLIILGTIVGVVSLLIGTFVVLDKKDRYNIISKLKSRKTIC